ncbi:MAG: hypothetical protein QW207_02760 [Candidatus Micrarchaeaceae archaeon]
MTKEYKDPVQKLEFEIVEVAKRVRTYKEIMRGLTAQVLRIKYMRVAAPGSPIQVRVGRRRDSDWIPGVLIGRKDNKRGISYQVLIQSEQGAKVLQVPEWRVRPSEEMQHALDVEAAQGLGISHA